MASVNKVIIVGNLGKDPEVRSFPNGDQVCSVSIATTDKWKDKQTGEPREHTEWHRVQFFGRLAEVAGEYLRKGSQVYVEGSLRTRSYEQDGVTKYTTEIRADQMKMLGSRQQGGDQGDGYGDQQSQRQQSQRQGGYGGQRQQTQRQQAQRQPARQQRQNSSGFEDMDDDIPFLDPLKRRGLHLAI